MTLVLRLRGVIDGIWGEVAKFGIVGAAAFVVDHGGYSLLVFGLPGTGGGPMQTSPVAASVAATAAAMLFSWVGNRYWTYRDQRRDNIAHELGLFILVNIIGMLITAGALLMSRHLLGLHSLLSDNVARILGWALATLFRFFAYRRHVFVSP